MPNQGRFPHNLSNGRNSARSHVRFHTSSSRICGAITQCLQIKGWLDLWWKLLWRHHALILISFVWLQLTTFLLRLGACLQMIRNIRIWSTIERNPLKYLCLMFWWCLHIISEFPGLTVEHYHITLLLSKTRIIYIGW